MIYESGFLLTWKDFGTNIQPLRPTPDAPKLWIFPFIYLHWAGQNKMAIHSTREMCGKICGNLSKLDTLQVLEIFTSTPAKTNGWNLKKYRPNTHQFSGPMVVFSCFFVGGVFIYPTFYKSILGCPWYLVTGL